MWWRALLLLTVLLTGCASPDQPSKPAADANVAVAAPAVSPPTVAAVVPEPNSSAVVFDSALFVQFNRPVVPLTTLEHAPSDVPVHIDPPVQGSGHWINTGLFTFKPDVGWSPSTTYHVTTPADGYAWSFSTLPPAIATTAPEASATLIDPAAPVRVTFNQPVDSNKVGFALDPPVNGHVEWSDNRTLVFRADTSLSAGAAYQVDVTLDGLTGLHTWRFTTAPEPAVIRGTLNAAQVDLLFSAPMDADDVRAKLTVQPELDYSLYPQWSDNFTHAVLRGPFKPQTQYELKLPAGTLDHFGRAIKDDFSLGFQTPAVTDAPPSPPQAWLISPFLGGTLNFYDHPHVLLRTTNVSHFDYTVNAVDEAFAARVYAANPADAMPGGTQMLSGSVDIRFERNTPTLNAIDLQKLKPGYYVIHVQPNEVVARVPDHLIVITRTLLAVKQSATQAMVWAVDLKSGDPLPNAPVRLMRGSSPAPVAQGLTDADGMFQADVPPPTGPQWNAVEAVVDRSGDATFALSTWSGPVGPWSFGLSAGFWRGPSANYVTHVYTDRPIYGPGQIVHLKGIVRNDDDASYTLPGDSFNATWQVRDNQGRVMSSGSIGRLSEFGTFDADVELSTEAATGAYSFNLQRDSQTLTLTNFVVADYQRPEFEVRVNAPGEVVSGQPLAASVSAAYYFGQMVAGADVHWRVTAEPFNFTWPRDPTFTFGETDLRAPRRVTPPTNAARSEGKTTTGDNGAASVQVPDTLAQNETSQKFTLEATVTDASHAEVSNRTAVVVHKAGLYLGLRPATFVAQAGHAQTIQLVALDMHSQPRTGVSVHVQVLRRRWMSVRERDAQGELHWISRPEDTPLMELDAEAGADGRGSFSFTPPEGGEYRLIVEAPDGSGNTAHTAISVWVAGPGFIPWRINDDGRLELQADKAQYRPGDVAHVILPSPMANGTALVTVERGKLLSRSVMQLSGNSTVLDVPIGSEHVPNAFVSVLLFGSAQSTTLWTGYVELPVASDERQLQVTVDPDQHEHAPGDRLTYTISTRASSGQGVPAEVSLALVDAAVLALADAHSDPVMAFWHRRPLGVQSGSSLGASIDRMNESASSGLKGGGGGASTTTRQDFPDTAFWAPAIRTDGNGMAHVEVHLPDTLTTWRLSAVAVTRDTRVGVASSDVITSKPLLVRPLTPRFLVGGDVIDVGAVVHNMTNAPLAATASLSVDGVALHTDTTRALDLPAASQAHVDWRVSVAPGQTGEATLHFAAAAGTLSDAVDTHVALLPWGASTTVATAGEVAPGGTTDETLDLPRDIDPARGELKVEVVPSLAAALRYSLRQVEEYPYECVEQTVSRFLPRLALDRAINGLGLNDPLNLKVELPGLVTRSIQRIYRFQHPDGGWGWWSNDISSPYITAYALSGLVEARRAGFAVDPAVIDRASAYLREWLNGDPGAYGLETRAYVLYLLGEAGSADPSRVAALFDRRADLLALGKAYLAMAMSKIDANDARVGGLVAELTNSADVSATGSHWEETDASVKGWLMATDVRTTSAVLDALIRLRPDHPLIPSAVRWLMAARRDTRGFWETTHDTAQSLLTLTDYLSTSGELQGAFEWQLGVNGHTQQNGKVATSTLADEPAVMVLPIPSLQIGSNQVELIRSIGPGRLYYSMQLRSFAPSDEIRFVDHGITVGREYLRLGTSEPASEVHVGDLVQVRLTVMAPASLQALVVEDPLPAGLEPADTQLRTTSQALAGAVGAVQQEPRRQPWTHLDVRDDHVALFADYVGRGAFQYTYVARAALPGEFRILPVNAREQYFPEVFGHGDGQRLRILP